MKSTLLPAALRGWVARGLLCLALPVALAVGAGDDRPKPALKAESFDKDPGWEGQITASCRRTPRR
jgi:hypothetical protein